METFEWLINVGAEGEVQQATLETQFGDGYSQATGVGINNQRQNWSVEVMGTYGGNHDITPIKEFLDRHQGFKSFLWAPPNGKQGRYRAKGRRESVISQNGVRRISWTMEQVFYPNAPA